MKRFNWMAIGPGLVMAAAGVGAGDIITSSMAGAKFGFALFWAVVFGTLLKYTLNEGLIRWQVVSKGKTMIRAWRDEVGVWLSYGFLVYLVFWSIFVGGGLLTSMGVVTQVMFKSLSVKQAGVICSIMVLGLVFTKSYRVFENIMKVFVAIMFIGFAYGAFLVLPEAEMSILGVFIPVIPSGSMLYVLGLIGGVGGSLTIMCYGYWAREKGLDKLENLPTIRLDLGIGYAVTAIFNLSVLTIAAVTCGTEAIKGVGGVLLLAGNLSAAIGPAGYWIFVVGFWGAIFSSLISFFSAIPYLFCDVIATIRKYNSTETDNFVSMANPWFWGYSLFLALVSILMLQFQRPILFVMAFSIMGGVFMVFLSGVLIYFNNKEVLGKFKNGVMVNVLLSLNLLLFFILLIQKITKWF